jgi:DNA sulfur modification protein DndB
MSYSNVGMNQAEQVLPYDPSEGTPLPVLEIDEHTCVAVMSVQHLLQVVPDPIASEKPDRVAEDPRLRKYAARRQEVQRLVEGAKAKNAHKYARYLIEGYADGERPAITPAITLYHPDHLTRVDLAPGVRAVVLRHGDYLAAIDGETQRIGWGYGASERPELLRRKVGVVIHHGKPEMEARQGFYDLNTREVKPNQAVAISMDSQDPATKITREVIEASVVKDRVNMRRRQLRRKDEDLLTISALRTGIVTTILGESGLQVGARPVELPEGTELELVEHAVVEVWSAILEFLEEDLEPERRPEVVVSAPSILAGIGVLAHRAMPAPPRKAGEPALTVEEVLELLENVEWDRLYTDAVNDEPRSVWDGIAGKFTPAGRFSIGGPKEVGYAVAKALREPDSTEGRRVRGTT